MLDPWDTASGVLIGFDPGTINLGVAGIEIDPFSLDIRRVWAETLTAKNSYLDTHHVNTHGAKYARLNYFKQTIVNYLTHHNARYVYCEDAYYSRLTPNAYAPLVETIYMLRESVMEYDSNIPLNIIRSSEAKATLNIKGKGEQVKENVRCAIYGCMELMSFFDGDPLDCAEHALDALLVAYTGLQMMRLELSKEPYSRFTPLEVSSGRINFL